MAISTSDIGHY